MKDALAIIFGCIGLFAAGYGSGYRHALRKGNRKSDNSTGEITTMLKEMREDVDRRNKIADILNENTAHLKSHINARKGKQKVKPIIDINEEMSQKGMTFKSCL